MLLGGHSAGASAAVACAAWGFDGRPGHRDLDGLVLVDGGLLGSFTVRDLASVKRALADIRAKGPWTDLLGFGVSWAAQLFAELGGQAAARSPATRSSFQSFPLLPPYFRPPVPTRNPGHPRLCDRRGHRPRLPGPDPGARRGALGRRATGRAARSRRSPAWPRCSAPSAPSTPGSGTTPSASAWRSIRHRRCAATRRRGCWACAPTTRGRVLRGARTLIRRSRIPRGRSVLVDGSRTQSHLDPLVAAPSRNRFLKTLVPFLRRVG